MIRCCNNKSFNSYSGEFCFSDDIFNRKNIFFLNSCYGRKKGNNIDVDPMWSVILEPCVRDLFIAVLEIPCRCALSG